jgi:regulator of protease activity HflC (stomatin/prohibitin superfamily)
MEQPIGYEHNAIGEKKVCGHIVQTCPQGYKVIVYRFGRVKGILNPGAFGVLPFISHTRMVYVGLTSANICPENINTKDGFSLKVEASIQYKVIDADKAAHNIINLHAMLKDNVTTAIRQTFCLLNLEMILERQSSLSHDIRDQLNNQYAHLQDEINRENDAKDEKIELVENVTSSLIQTNEPNKIMGEIITKHARMYLEDYIGIKIGNINLERIHFPREFSETKTKIQQNHYTQLQLNIENDTKILKQQNDQKLIGINTTTECDRTMALAEMRKKETLVLTEAESLKVVRLAEAESTKIVRLAEARKEEMVILAKAQATELQILNEAIQQNGEAYKLKVLSLSSDAWKSVSGSSGSKLIISSGDLTSQPLSFINQMAVTKEIMDSK